MSVKDFDLHEMKIYNEGSLKVIALRRPNTSVYYIKFIIDHGTVFISGDLGFAVLSFGHYPVSVEILSGITESEYFIEKLVAFEGDSPYQFCPEKALESISNWEKDMKEEEIDYNLSMMSEFKKFIRNCDSIREFEDGLNDNFFDFIHSIDDEPGWLYRIGNVPSVRIQLYLDALKNINRRLKEISE